MNFSIKIYRFFFVFSIFYSFHLFYFVFFVFVLEVFQHGYSYYYWAIFDIPRVCEVFGCHNRIQNHIRNLRCPAKVFFFVFLIWLNLFLLFVSSFVILFLLKAHIFCFSIVRCSLFSKFKYFVGLFLFYFIWSLCFKTHFKKYSSDAQFKRNFCSTIDDR